MRVEGENWAFFVVVVAAYIRVAMIDCLAVGLVTNRYD